MCRTVEWGVALHLVPRTLEWGVALYSVAFCNQAWHFCEKGCDISWLSEALHVH